MIRQPTKRKRRCDVESEAESAIANEAEHHKRTRMATDELLRLLKQHHRENIHDE